VTPWVLRDSGNVTWDFTLGNLAEDYPIAHTPRASIGALNIAQILAVPEPSSYALTLFGIAALALVSLRQRHSAEATFTSFSWPRCSQSDAFNNSRRAE